MAQEIANSKLLDTWGSSGTKIEPDVSKIIEGWQLGEQPPHEYMNWLQNTFGSKLNHILKNGIAEWNNETEYLAGSSVQHSGKVWICETTNTNSEPTDLNANWEKVAINKDLTLTVDTVDDLRSISYPANTVWASGYHAKNDGAFGSHIFRLKGVKTTETDNGGTVIIATISGVDYVYELQYDGPVNVKWFGAKGDGATDDSINIQRAIDYSLSSDRYEPIYFNGIFVLYETLKYDGFVSLIGEKDAANGNTTQFYCYNPNCTLDIGFFNANPFSLAFSIKNISFVQKAPFVGTKKSILYVDSISSFELKNVDFNGYNELSNGTAINMVNTSNNMDLVKLDGVQLNFFENGIWLNRLDNSQSFAGHIYNIAGIGCKYYIRISGGAAFYNGSILANHITYNGNTENIIYIERGSLTNSEVKLYMESTSDIDLDGCVINLGSYIENYISGDISAYVGGDGFTDFITQRKILVSNMDLIGYDDFYCFQNYPNPITMTSNIHSSKRVQSYGVKSQNNLIFNNGYISRDYYPDDIISNKIGSVNTLINNKAPVLDTQSLSKGIKKYGRVKATAQANSEVLKFNTIDLFSTFISASNTIPKGTIGMRVKRTQLTASRINQTLFSSSDVDNSAFKFLFRSCTNYNEMSFQTDYSTSSTVNKSPSNWRLPFEREIIIYIKWNSTSTTVYWDGYKVKYNEAPKFGNFIYFGNSFMVNNESFCGSIYDISVWNTELPTSIIESFYLNDTKWS